MNDRPVAFIEDEAMNYLSTSDKEAFSTCREMRCGYVLGFQSLDGMTSELRDLYQVKTIMANIGTRFYMSNACPTTCEWSSEDAGEEWRLVYSASGVPDDTMGFFFPRLTKRRSEALPPLKNGSVNASWQRVRIIPPEKFAQLKAGTKKRSYAEAWVRMMDADGGRKFYKVHIPYRLERAKRGWFRRNPKGTVMLPWN